MTARWGKIADLARAGGFSERYARKLREMGRLVIGQGGLIDIPASLRLIAACRDPGRGGKRDRYTATAPPAASPPPEEVPEPPQRPKQPPAVLQPCLMQERGCRAQADGQLVSCDGWGAADMVLTGFQLGWLAREAATGAPGQLVELLRTGDPDLSISEAMGGRLYTALLDVYSIYAEAAPADRAGAPIEDLDA